MLSGAFSFLNKQSSEVQSFSAKVMIVTIAIVILMVISCVIALVLEGRAVPTILSSLLYVLGGWAVTGSSFHSGSSIANSSGPTPTNNG